MTSLVLHPSPSDRLDPVAAAVRWWTSRLAETFARGSETVIGVDEVEHPERRRLPRRIAIALPAEEIFVSRAALPPGSPEAHKKALLLRLAELAPLDPAGLEIAVRRVGADGSGAAVYALAMARAERLAALEALARPRGARAVRFQADGDDRVWLQTSRARRVQARARIADMVLIFALVVSAVAATSAVTRELERKTEALLAADQAARRASVEAERAARDSALSRELVARGVLRRRAGEALADLAALNAATPDGTWWTAVRWTPGEVALAGASTQAAEAIATLSAAASGWSVALAGPVRASDAGVQTFELRALKRDEKREGSDGG